MDDLMTLLDLAAAVLSLVAAIIDILTIARGSNVREGNDEGR